MTKDTQKSFKVRMNHMIEAMDEIAYALEKYKSGGKDIKYYYYAAQKKAEEVIESAISINQDILYGRFEHLPESYRKSFADLDRAEIFSEKELSELVETAGFRNRLAHEYVELDPQLTVEEMAKILRLYPHYVQKVSEYLGLN